MANRAYLYSDDRPDAWDWPDEDYYDSRWTIPLAWFFFFRPEDVRLVEDHYGDSQWQEVRLSAEKAPALALFERRWPLLASIINRRLPDAAVADFVEAVADFVETVGGRPGRHLLVDPTEVLGGFGPESDDQTHAERLGEILAILGEGVCSADIVLRIMHHYVGDLSPDPDRFRCQVLGYTYWSG